MSLSLPNRFKKQKQKVKKRLKSLVLGVYRLGVRCLPLNKRIILFESNLGRNYTGNPRAIYEEMVRQGLDRQYRCYFILEDVKTPLPGAAVPVKRSRFLYFYLFAVAGIWVCDTRLPKYIVKKPGSTYIQTWHGTPLKKLALDMDAVFMAGEGGIENYKKNFYNNTRTWDYLISQNHYSTEIFRRAFAFDKEVLEIGYPRNDVLFAKNNPDSIRELKRKAGLPQDKKILLYAPTWRDNEFYGKGKYKFNPALDFAELQKRLGEEYILIVKYHYLVMDQIDWSPYQGFIYPCDLSYDISNLYLISDMLITDYSSVMFDYSLLRRPMFFFCYDLEEYKDTLRGFYFDFLAEAPGPVTMTTGELIEAIKNYDRAEYREREEAFYLKYNHTDDGKASQRVTQLIQTLTQ
ncbi:CDP-glycerol glycerophosphotransferase [Anaerotaenia torta]|uniref:CDP-glycerol glycerophosphotransferase family protein n=1 Tax=Anaerotaenia torta TaxID=433293 RepID=UPI003D20A02E